jgi:hypothetical protein
MGASNGGRGNTGGAATDGVYEHGLIEALCAPGGMRAMPPRDKLEQFVQQARTLEPECVCPLIEEKLYDEVWQVNTKALAVIEALCKNDQCAPYFDYFADNIDAINSLQHSNKASVRDKAIKVSENTFEPVYIRACLHYLRCGSDSPLSRRC